MATAQATEPSEEDVLAALRAIASENPDSIQNSSAAVTEPEATEQVENSTEPTTEAPAEAAKAEAVIGQVDDIESLKARLKATEENLENYRGKVSSSLEWSRNLTLKKATEADQLRNVLRKIKEKGEVSAEEIDRYLSPAQQGIPQTSGQSVAPDDGLAQVEAFRFQNDYRLDDEKSAAFDAWIRAQSASGGIRQQEIIEGNPYATLQSLYLRYEREAPRQQAVVQDTPALVKAAQNVARTQRAAARVAGPPARSSPASTPPDSGVDLSELIKKDPDKALQSGLIDRLFKEVNASGGF